MKSAIVLIAALLLLILTVAAVALFIDIARGWYGPQQWTPYDTNILEMRRQILERCKQAGAV